MKRIAIVDDDSIFQFTTKVKIEKLKLADRIDIFNDGEEVFAFLSESSLEDMPSVMLLDINMPVLDGWDFLDIYHQIDEVKREQIQIYMLSSSINPVDVEKAQLHADVVDYITKPINDQVLVSILGSDQGSKREKLSGRA